MESPIKMDEKKGYPYDLGTPDFIPEAPKTCPGMAPMPTFLSAAPWIGKFFCKELQFHATSMGVFIGDPQNGWFITDNPMDNSGYPYLDYLGNLHICTYKKLACYQATLNYRAPQCG